MAFHCNYLCVLYMYVHQYLLIIYNVLRFTYKNFNKLNFHWITFDKKSKFTQKSRQFVYLMTQKNLFYISHLYLNIIKYKTKKHRNENKLYHVFSIYNINVHAIPNVGQWHKRWVTPQSYQIKFLMSFISSNKHFFLRLLFCEGCCEMRRMWTLKVFLVVVR